MFGGQAARVCVRTETEERVEVKAAARRVGTLPNIGRLRAASSQRRA